MTVNYLNSREQGEALAAELGTEAVRCDVSDSAQVKAMFERTGGVDLLVCNAGIAWSGLISDMTDSEWRRIVDVNLAAFSTAAVRRYRTWSGERRAASCACPVC